MRIGAREIGPQHPPYIIAELCNNFGADMGRAMELIDIAHEAGADAAKFQMRLRPDRLSPDEHAELKRHCDDIGITWLCSVFDVEGAKIVEEIGVPAHKIPSGEVGNEALAKAVSSFGKPVLASLGMCEEREAFRWVSWLKHTGPDYRFLDVIPMQTTSIYPCPYSHSHLRWPAVVFQDATLWGLSDHTPTIWTAIAATALGASVIEKHLTLGRTQEGPDHASSLEPRELHELVEATRAVHDAMGDEKRLFPEEREKALIHKFGMRDG